MKFDEIIGNNILYFNVGEGEVAKKCLVRFLKLI